MADTTMRVKNAGHATERTYVRYNIRGIRRDQATKPSATYSAKTQAWTPASQAHGHGYRGEVETGTADKASILTFSNVIRWFQGVRKVTG